MADKKVMDLFEPNQHGSTYGGNPLGCSIAMEALKILEEEKLAENAYNMGEKLRAALNKQVGSIVKSVRGKGLLNAIILQKNIDSSEFCYKLKDRGLLAKPTHGDKIRLAPPLIINEQQLDESILIIIDTINSY
ncbi:hypothetical protein A3Q56_07748 [Intoshia linei]|uniref:Ornithine aminotransferase n=1 Tax=Intoshia linei TaxID=1819745 RepID=A0A177ATI7_9BILA|nr:hypothetical protein A3Q56_07748 [Intoshia linei]